MDNSQKITRELHLDASSADVWDTLTNPAKTSKFMFNCKVESNWQVGSSIAWKGNYQGYESGERGTIIAVEKGRLLKYSSFDPNFGLADIAENYLHITYELTETGGKTRLVTSIENFNGDPERMKHIASGWDNIVLPALASYVNTTRTE